MPICHIFHLKTYFTLVFKMANYKRIFLDGYSYYLTVVTHNRNPILIDNIELLRESFKESKEHYSYAIEAIVILPDHFHLVIKPKIAKEYPHIIRTIKQYFSKHCDKSYYAHIEQSPSRQKEGYTPIWQKKYYEHTIRDTQDHKSILAYMYHNPIKHGLVEKPDLWIYSSF